MRDGYEQFEKWIENKAENQNHFSATFWFLFSNLGRSEFVSALRLDTLSGHDLAVRVAEGPGGFVEAHTQVAITKRSGRVLKAEFSLLPSERDNVYILFSLNKPGDALRPMYRLLGRSRGRVQLFPFGHSVMRSCAQLTPSHSLEHTCVLRGVSYPSQPNEGGAEINLRPGHASAFFERVDEERRVLKTVKLRVPTSGRRCCELSAGRPGYVTYHKGEFAPLWRRMAGALSDELLKFVGPFRKATGRFVEFRFPEPLFVERQNYRTVLNALSRLPRASVALLHTNPYFHATVTNYEDGAEFDVFITDHSTIHVQGQGEVSPASFLRIQNGFTELFRDATISLEQPTRYTFQQLMEGRV